jgi:RNA methyltransferase, TrmH family
MLSQAKIKWIRSLEHKKFRQEEGFFTGEGSKICTDLLEDLPCRFLTATASWLETHPDIRADEIVTASKEDLRKASLLKTPPDVLAVFKIPTHELTPDLLNGKISLVLDYIQDPGNLGTILRIADWFGIENVICSIGTVDAFNPKTVQATMGAIGRVHIHYTELVPFLKTVHIPIYGSFLEGEVIYTCSLEPEGLIIMGNEGNGISKETATLITNKLYIPDYPAGQTGSESLNVSVATAIICSEFRRRTYK